MAFPVVARYEDQWPVEMMLKQYLENQMSYRVKKVGIFRLSQCIAEFWPRELQEWSLISKAQTLGHLIDQNTGGQPSEVTRLLHQAETR